MENILNKFKYILIILLASIIVAIFFVQYLNIKEIINEKYLIQQQMVEKNILQTVDYVNDAYKIAEQELNQEMKIYSEIMVEKYKKEPDVMGWDLGEMKQQFANYDIYIVDNNLKIIKTSYEKDLGLDFSKFGSFATILKERLEGDKFEVDRIDLSTQTGDIKKYSYMPSPDHEYLFELSISVQDKFPSFNSLNIFKDAAVLSEEYEMVQEIAFYSVEPLNHRVAKLRSTKKPYLDPDVSEFKEELARQAVINNTVQSNSMKEGGKDYSYRFFPALISDKEGEKGWNSYVVGITYNNQIRYDEISENRRLFIINILLMIIFFISFIVVVLYLLRKFEHQACHDKLTGLANRKYFTEEFEKLKKKADDNENNIALIFIDIDKFKELNDNYGHGVGDKVLENIALRMKNNLKAKDVLARVGGDEFVIVLVDLKSKNKILNIAERLIKNIKEPLIIDGQEISVSVSGGISIYPEDGVDLEELIEIADSAMYRAKREGKDVEIGKL